MQHKKEDHKKDQNSNKPKSQPEQGLMLEVTMGHDISSKVLNETKIDRK